MRDPDFEHLVRRSVEEKRPLDTARFRALAATVSPQARNAWADQVRLDRAIDEWRGTAGRVPTASPHVGRGRRSRIGLSAGLAAALVAGVAALFVFPRPTPDARIVTVEDLVPEPIGEAEPSAPVAGLPTGATVASNSGDFEEATRTARRLAHAFSPVGEQVDSALSLLIEAVPGSDVFAL